MSLGSLRTSILSVHKDSLECIGLSIYVLWDVHDQWGYFFILMTLHQGA